MWGAMAPVSKYVMSAGLIGSIVVTDVRIFGAALLFWVFSLFSGGEKVERRDFPRLFFAGLFAIVLNQGVYITGVSMTSPVDASIITTSLPIVTMIFAAVWLKEPITVMKAGGSNLLGDLLCFCAQCSYAVYLVLFKDLIVKYSPVTLMKWMFTFASVVMIPFTIGKFVSTTWEAVPVAQFAGLAFILFCGTFLCYLLVPVGQRNLRPTLVAMYNYVQPVVATVIAIIWGMDSFNILKVLAVILVFSGVLLVNRSKSREDVLNASAGK